MTNTGLQDAVSFSYIREILAMKRNIFMVYDVTLFNAVKENTSIFQIFFISLLS